MEFLLSDMRRIQEQHPKANISYDTVRCRIYITYPLPIDFLELKDINIDTSHLDNIKR